MFCGNVQVSELLYFFRALHKFLCAIACVRACIIGVRVTVRACDCVHICASIMHVRMRVSFFFCSYSRVISHGVLQFVSFSLFTAMCDFDECCPLYVGVRVLCCGGGIKMFEMWGGREGGRGMMRRAGTPNFSWATGLPASGIWGVSFDPSSGAVFVADTSTKVCRVAPGGGACAFVCVRLPV